jgi:beta-lactam-binding protein with PASTA domain
MWSSAAAAAASEREDPPPRDPDGPSRTYSAKIKKGKIISQARRPGVRLPRGTRVNVLISRGRRR